MMLFYTFVETKKKENRNNVVIVYWIQFNVTHVVYIKGYLCMLH